MSRMPRGNAEEDHRDAELAIARNNGLTRRLHRPQVMTEHGDKSKETEKEAIDTALTRS